ncbi:MAG TPA: adenylate/guanylate cyclase domain-containing protein [Candidatus Nanopelagicales bacterium]
MSACSNCAVGLPIGAKFCAECGHPASPRVCPSCGTPAETGKFCAECGTALDGASPAATVQLAGPVAERRVTSVLFGDLVGFTPLSESKDSEEVRELLSAYFQQCRVIVARYGGVVEKFIGDAVMAVWGVPVAHEDDAERAVRAGLELVAMVTALGDEVGAPGLAQRVGIVTGEVAVTVGATAEGMVAGDAVNTAARVQSAAAPGQVWVDETTRTLTMAAIAYQDTGEHELKGKAEAQRLFSARAVVAEVGGGQRVDGLEAPMTGRTRELRLVKELFHATQESQRPRLVVVDGDPGIGKSRLAWEFEKYVDGLTATTRWHRGRCLSYGDGVAFWALSEAIRARLGLTEGDTGDIVQRQLEESLTQFVPDTDERDWLRPRLAALVGASATGEFARDDLFAAWTAFLEHLAGTASAAVLVLDDAQHADDGLLDFVDHLLATARAPVFVLALARPELLMRRPELGGRRTTVLRLDPLDDTAMAALVDGLVVGLPDETRRALVSRAEGVPLFAVETVRALIDRDMVLPRGGRYVLSDEVTLDLNAIGAPASLQALVAARLDALTVDERRVVSDASVLGMSFTREGLEALGANGTQLDDVLGSLGRREILAVQTDRFSAERGQYRFVQSVVRQVAYGMLSKRDRKIRHIAAADFVGALLDDSDEFAVVIAQHLLDALDACSSGDPDIGDLKARACSFLERAATRASKLGAPADATRLLEAAIEHCNDTGDLGRLHLAASLSAMENSDAPIARKHARSATTAFDDLGRPIDAGLSAAAEANSLEWVADHRGAIGVATPRWESLQDVPGAEPALFRLASVLGSAYWTAEIREQATPYLDRMVLLAEALDDAAGRSRAYNALAIRYSALRAPRTAADLFGLAGEVARSIDDPGTLCMALTGQAILQVSRDLQVALGLNAESLEAARRSGNRGNIEVAYLNIISAELTAGHLSAVAALLATARDLAVIPGLTIALGAQQAWLNEALGLPVDAPAAEVDVPDEPSSRAWRASHDIAWYLSRADTERAAQVARAMKDDLLAAGGLEDDFMHMWPPAVIATLAAGQLDGVDELLGPVLTAPPNTVSDAVSAQLLRFRGQLSAARGGVPEETEALQRAGIDALATFGATGHRAQAQEELARWLVEQHRGDDAQPLIDAARATYTEIGATGWLAKLDDWLASRQSAPTQ